MIETLLKISQTNHPQRTLVLDSAKKIMENENIFMSQYEFEYG